MMLLSSVETASLKEIALRVDQFSLTMMAAVLDQGSEEQWRQPV
jgi:hypothetical protein